MPAAVLPAASAVAMRSRSRWRASRVAARATRIVTVAWAPPSRRTVLCPTAVCPARSVSIERHPPVSAAGQVTASATTSRPWRRSTRARPTVGSRALVSPATLGTGIAVVPDPVLGAVLGAGAGAGVEHVVAGAAAERVDLVATGQRVVPVPAVGADLRAGRPGRDRERVVPAAAGERDRLGPGVVRRDEREGNRHEVGALECGHAVVDDVAEVVALGGRPADVEAVEAVAAGQLVGAVAVVPDQVVVPGPAVDEVQPAVAAQAVVAGAALDEVVTPRGELVVAVEAREDVVAVAAVQGQRRELAEARRGVGLALVGAEGVVATEPVELELLRAEGDDHPIAVQGRVALDDLVGHRREDVVGGRGAGDVELVRAGAAVGDLEAVAGVPHRRVVALVAVGSVEPSPAFEPVVARPAVEHVGAGPAGQEVVAVPRVDRQHVVVVDAQRLGVDAVIAVPGVDDDDRAAVRGQGGGDVVDRDDAAGGPKGDRVGASAAGDGQRVPVDRGGHVGLRRSREPQGGQRRQRGKDREQTHGAA